MAGIISARSAMLGISVIVSIFLVMLMRFEQAVTETPFSPKEAAVVGKKGVPCACVARHALVLGGY